jgi:hypothetical protein
MSDLPNASRVGGNEPDSAQPNQIREFESPQPPGKLTVGAGCAPDLQTEPDSAQPNQIHELRTASPSEKLAVGAGVRTGSAN